MMEERAFFWYRAVREGLSEEVTFNPRPDGLGGISLWSKGRTFPARGESKAKALR